MKEDLILLSALHKISKLEVLKVRTSAFGLTNEQEEASGTRAWLKVEDSCEYTVDLTSAEFIVDHIRKTVVVRIPKPVPSNFQTVDIINVLTDTSIFAGSALTGNALYDRLTQEATQEIIKSVFENQDYYNSAEKSAIRIIENAVTKLNPSIDVKVYVEFF